MIRGTLRYQMYRWLAWTIERAPRRAAYGFTWLVAEVAFAVNAPARRVAVFHMRRILGPDAAPASVRRAARGCLHAATWYYTDLPRTARMDVRRFNTLHVHDTGFEHLRRAAAAGRGVVIVTMHFGNPEYAAQVLPYRGLPLMSLVEPLEPPALAELFRSYRASQGNSSAEVTLSGIKRALRCLRGGGIVAVLVDRDILQTGIEVPVFGYPARIPTGAIDLALHTGAAIVPLMAKRAGIDQFEVTIEPPLVLERTGRLHDDRRVNLSRLMERFEPYLRRDPAQWFVLQETIWPRACGARSTDGRDGGNVRPRGGLRRAIRRGGGR